MSTRERGPYDAAVACVERMPFRKARGGAAIVLEDIRLYFRSGVDGQLPGNVEIRGKPETNIACDTPEGMMVALSILVHQGFRQARARDVVAAATESRARRSAAKRT
jgi:hypothetical protein